MLQCTFVNQGPPFRGGKPFDFRNSATPHHYGIPASLCKCSLFVALCNIGSVSGVYLHVSVFQKDSEQWSPGVLGLDDESNSLQVRRIAGLY